MTLLALGEVKPRNGHHPVRGGRIGKGKKKKKKMM